jgi:phage terminase large subunit
MLQVYDEECRRLHQSNPQMSEGQVKSALKPRAIVCDHDAGHRATLEKHLRMSTVAAKKDISPGLQAVASRLKVAGDGKPRLFLLRNSVVERDPLMDEAKRPLCTEQEIDAYVWDTTGGRNKGEVPVDKDNHGIDAMRYLVARLDGQPATPPARPRVLYVPPTPNPYSW